MKIKACTAAVRGALLLGAALTATSALAGYDVYSKGDTKLTFNVDAAAAAFENKDSWFGESNSFLGNTTDNWSEYGVEPRLSLEVPVAGGTVYGQLSGVYTATDSDDASGLTIGGGDSDDFNTEQGHLGWKVSNVFDGLENDSFSISTGRQDYKIGTGMLIADGGSDGGHYGGWYIGMRKAFKGTVIASLKSDEMLLEGFRLENRPRRGGTEGEAYGANGEYTFFGSTKLGASYIVVDAELPGYDDLDVYDGRLDWTPGGALEGLALSGEFAHEESDQIDADGWFAQLAYQTKELCWTPTFSYRYAHFDGDDLDTPEEEQFREIAYGYTDYGSWYQGEITGNYPLANGNLNSHQLRVKAQPSDSVTLNVIYYDFTLDQQHVWGDPVSSDDWGQEIDLTVDWAATDQIYVIGVLGALLPGDAAEEWVGNDQDWLYSMLYVSYSY
jgi:hypothetical protein